MLFRTSRVVQASPQVSAIFLRLLHCRVYIVIENTRTYNLIINKYINFLSFELYFYILYYPAYCQLGIPIAMATAGEDTLTKVSTEGKSQIIR